MSLPRWPGSPGVGRGGWLPCPPVLGCLLPFHSLPTVTPGNVMGRPALCVPWHGPGTGTLKRWSTWGQWWVWPHIGARQGHPDSWATSQIPQGPGGSAPSQLLPVTPGDGPAAGQEWGGFRQGRRGLGQRPAPRDGAGLAPPSCCGCCPELLSCLSHFKGRACNPETRGCEATGPRSHRSWTGSPALPARQAR